MSKIHTQAQEDRKVGGKESGKVNGRNNNIVWRLLCVYLTFISARQDFYVCVCKSYTHTQTHGGKVSETLETQIRTHRQYQGQSINLIVHSSMSSHKFAFHLLWLCRLSVCVRAYICVRFYLCVGCIV